MTLIVFFFDIVPWAWTVDTSGAIWWLRLENLWALSHFLSSDWVGSKWVFVPNSSDKNIGCVGIGTDLAEQIISSWYARQQLLQLPSRSLKPMRELRSTLLLPSTPSLLSMFVFEFLFFGFFSSVGKSVMRRFLCWWLKSFWLISAIDLYRSLDGLEFAVLRVDILQSNWSRIQSVSWLDLSHPTSSIKHAL